MLHSLYYWTLSIARSRHALWGLAAVAFVQSSIFPIPPDVLMIAMIIATPSRAFLIAGVATAASVAGAVAGYAIGFGAFETIGRPVLAFYGLESYFAAFAARYNDWGAWVVLVAGVSPFPFKVITILSGATQLSLPVFVIASLIARALRFFVLAALLWHYGTSISDFIERRLGLVFTVFCVLLIGGFMLVRYL